MNRGHRLEEPGQFPLLPRVLLVLGLAVLTGCGSAVGGLVAALDDDSSSNTSNATPVVSDLAIVGDPRVSPLEIVFDLFDVESDTVEVVFSFRSPSHPITPMHLVADPSRGIDTNTQLASSPEGNTYSKLWDFASHPAHWRTAPCRPR